MPALWLMPVGWSLARIAGSDDPGTMLAAAGVGWWTAALITLASVTTNFVNIYLSSLAWRTLAPRSTGAGSVWTIGLIGTALGLISSGWLTQFAELMVLLGSMLVPVGGVFLAHFVVLRKPIDVARIYDARRAARVQHRRHCRVGSPASLFTSLRRRSALRYRRSRPRWWCMRADLAKRRREALLLHRIHIDVTFVKSRQRTLAA